MIGHGTLAGSDDDWLCDTEFLPQCLASSVTDEAGSPGNGGALFRSQDGPGHVALCHGVSSKVKRRFT